MKCLLIGCILAALLLKSGANNEPNDDQPLILTPYIEKGQIEEAQRLANVTDFSADVVSYSGFFTVNPEYNSNLYFWFFPTQNPDAPVLLWLEGGPGTSSLFGLFVENGPFEVDDSVHLKARNTSWTKFCHVIYIDNPVGTGFSFTDDDRGYAKDQTAVANDLYSALVQFFTMFPQYQSNSFYIAGESYAGKYGPAISFKIHNENLAGLSNFKINLKGLAIGDGSCDPVTMLDYGSFLYNIGLISVSEWALFKEQESQVKQHIENEEWLEASEVWLNLITVIFPNVTGFDDYYNYLSPADPLQFKYPSFIELPKTRKSLHVGNQTYSDGSQVLLYLRSDLMKSVKPWVEQLLDNDYRVLLYSGQMDIIVAHTFTQNFISKLKWKGADEFAASGKTILRVGDQLAGYGWTGLNLQYVIIRNAGHMVAYYQPEWTYQMMKSFLQDE